MIRHWAYALNDMNPAYLDPEFAEGSRYGGIVSPPVMLQCWTMAPPKLEGIHERGGVPVEIKHNPLQFLADAGYTGIIATNSEFEIERYPGSATTSPPRPCSKRSPMRRRPPWATASSSPGSHLPRSERRRHRPPTVPHAAIQDGH